jgi:hypothetical protein
MGTLKLLLDRSVWPLAQQLGAIPVPGQVGTSPLAITAALRNAESAVACGWWGCSPPPLSWPTTSASVKMGLRPCGSGTRATPAPGAHHRHPQPLAVRIVPLPSTAMTARWTAIRQRCARIMSAKSWRRPRTDNAFPAFSHRRCTSGGVRQVLIPSKPPRRPCPPPPGAHRTAHRGRGA